MNGEEAYQPGCLTLSPPGPNRPNQPIHTVEEWDDEHPKPGKKVKLTNGSKSGAKEDAILDALRDISDNLDDDCAKFLGGRDAVLATINALVSTGGSPLIAHGGIDPNSIAAFTGGRPDDFVGTSLATLKRRLGTLRFSSTITARFSVATT